MEGIRQQRDDKLKWKNTIQHYARANQRSSVARAIKNKTRFQIFFLALLFEKFTLTQAARHLNGKVSARRFLIEVSTRRFYSKAMTRSQWLRLKIQSLTPNFRRSFEFASLKAFQRFVNSSKLIHIEIIETNTVFNKKQLIGLRSSESARFHFRFQFRFKIRYHQIQIFQNNGTCQQADALVRI